MLAQIGWRVGQLDGGYKAYRRAVLPIKVRPKISPGAWYADDRHRKSRLLRALDTACAQVSI
jgi:hypothetical protein